MSTEESRWPSIKRRWSSVRRSSRCLRCSSTSTTFQKSCASWQNFAKMVTEAPPGALDPNASNYIVHSGSAAARGETTGAQNETMSS
jgi:hypothetical protein